MKTPYRGRRRRGFPVSVCLAGILVLALGAGCLTTGSAKRQSTSVVQYLFPEKSPPKESEAMPVLALPIKVGLAWVPGSTARGRYANQTDLSEQAKMDLARQILPHFETNNFVESIQIIPSAYLRQEGSFANLDQLRSMFGIDVVVLLSYDQMQFTDEGLLSLVYWTIVGAYVVKGEKNDTQTMLDAVVYDIPSRTLLFRAPGVSQVKAAATPINLTEQLRKDSRQGFDHASTNLVANLQGELDRFRDRLKEKPDEIKVVRKPGFKGAGALGWLETALVLAGAGWAIRFRRRFLP